MSYGDKKIVLDTTIDKALNKLFSKQEDSKTRKYIEDNKINSMKEAKIIYDKAIEAQKKMVNGGNMGNILKTRKYIGIYGKINYIT